MNIILSTPYAKYTFQVHKGIHKDLTPQRSQLAVLPVHTIGTLRSENGDVLENLAENRLCILSNHFAIIPCRQLLKRREFVLELKRGVRSRVQAEMVEFIALPFSSSKNPKIWSFYVVVVQGRQRNLQKGVMYV